MSLFSKITSGGRSSDDPTAMEEGGRSHQPSSTLQDDALRLSNRSKETGHADEHAEGQSIFTAVPPSSILPTEPDGSESTLELPGAASGSSLPIIGQLPVGVQQRVLWGMLALGAVGLVLSTVLTVRSGNATSIQVAASGQSLMQSQRLAKAVSQAILGDKNAFGEVKDSVKSLMQNTQGLSQGDSSLGIRRVTAPAVASTLESLAPVIERTDKNAQSILAHEKVLTEVNESLRAISRGSGDLLDISDSIASLKLQLNAPSSEISATGQLVMLTQRIGKSANEFVTSEGVSPEAVFLIGKDLNTFEEIAHGLLEGNSELRLSPARDAQTRERLNALLKTFEGTRAMAAGILNNLQGLVSAREAQFAIVSENNVLLKGLQEVQDLLSSGGSGNRFSTILIALSFILLALTGWGLVTLSMGDQRQRAALAELQRGEAERLEGEAKRVNDANQAAILRLMNELQVVAEGDLTQQATVTEDITGAIADSVNYTVEELRTLVAQVQGTADRVTNTTQLVETTSVELLAASDEQLREIRDTGESMLQMATRINQVSSQAQQSADVARQSLAAAETGLNAVQNAIGGMNAIREQIQDTSKRIKRLGESSQEIGEITELISDITEQTNVLALNAAIQAASAGEAGRGFSVVAEEVQRLAERSGDATRQISALVKTIQTDTADAVAAMERSTQGVVEGAKLSDNAGSALGEIDRVSRQLAELIEQISNQALREAQSANVMAGSIQHIFAVTEQTGEGTRSTAQLVRELSRTAEELKHSVSRFKIS